MLDKHGNYTKIAEVTGIPAQTLNKWGVKHGINKKPRIDKHVKRRVITLLANGMSYSEIAKRAKVSKATVSRIAKEGNGNNG